jgi:hypothetical protein
MLQVKRTTGGQSQRSRTSTHGRDSLQVVVLILVLQLGGIPPTGTWLGKLSWFGWILCVFGQWITTCAALVLVVVSYISLESRHGDCMVELYGGYKYLTLTIPALILHPNIIAKLTVMAAYMYVGLLGFSFGGRRLNSQMKPFRFYVKLFILPEMLASLLYWVFTGSILAAVCYFPLGVAVAAVAWCISKMLIWCKNAGGRLDTEKEGPNRERARTKSRNMSRSDSASEESSQQLTRTGSLEEMSLQQDEAKPTAKFSVRSWLAKQVRNSLWWVQTSKTKVYRLPLIKSQWARVKLERNFIYRMVYVSAVMFALSPLVIYGTWLTFYVYSGNSTPDVSKLFLVLYENACSAHFVFPNFSFRPQLLLKLPIVMSHLWTSFQVQTRARCLGFLSKQLPNLPIVGFLHSAAEGLHGRLQSVHRAEFRARHFEAALQCHQHGAEPHEHCDIEHGSRRARQRHVRSDRFQAAHAIGDRHCPHRGHLQRCALRGHQP